MRNRTKALSVTLIVVLALGCATTEGNQQAIGAAIGAATGGLICALTRANPAVCVAAAVGGAALGWGAVKVKQVVEHRYALAPTKGQPSVVITNYGVEPMMVQPGQTMVATTMYELKTPANVGPRPVTQTFKVLQDDKELGSYTPIAGQLKERGRYELTWEIDTPKEMAPGTYQLVQILDAQTAAPEVKTATFQVVKKTAWLERAPRGKG